MSNINEIELNNSYGIEAVIWSILKNNIYPGVKDEIINMYWSVLKKTIFPGAKDESIIMALEYCVAEKLNVFQKPVHIVPMSVKNSVSGKYEYRDVVMPGIGLYRIQAERSGQYAGIGVPHFGKEVTYNLGGVSVTCPAWCTITVKRVIGNFIAEFTASERWIENYATKSKETIAPNAIWTKRPYGQLAKCAEAQALRKGFAEFVSQQPTAEEMEGKFLEVNEIKNLTLKTESLNSIVDSVLQKQEKQENTDNVTVDKHSELQKLIENNRIPPETVNKWCEKAGVETIGELDEGKLGVLIPYVTEKYGHEQGRM